jgi:hypothetical protein
MTSIGGWHDGSEGIASVVLILLTLPENVGQITTASPSRCVLRLQMKSRYGRQLRVCRISSPMQ